MPFVIIALGIILLVAGIRSTEKDLFQLVKDDVLGSGGLIYWIVAIGLVGSLGYVKQLRPISIGVMSLILLVLVLKTGGGFSKLQSTLTATQASVESSGSSSGGLFGGILQNVTSQIFSSAKSLETQALPALVTAV